MGVAWDPSCKGFAWVVGDDNVGHLVNACAASAISVRRSDVGLCFGKFTRLDLLEMSSYVALPRRPPLRFADWRKVSSLQLFPNKVFRWPELCFPGACAKGR